MNSHSKPLFISFRSNGEKLIKYQANSPCVIMSVILMSTLFIKKTKTLILQGEIWCWSLLGLKGLSPMLLRNDHISCSCFVFPLIESFDIIHLEFQLWPNFSYWEYLVTISVQLWPKTVKLIMTWPLLSDTYPLNYIYTYYRLHWLGGTKSSRENS